LRRRGWQDEAEAAEARWSATLEWSPPKNGTDTLTACRIISANQDIRTLQARDCASES
jgi:hypothetical protein